MQDPWVLEMLESERRGKTSEEEATPGSFRPFPGVMGVGQPSAGGQPPQGLAFPQLATQSPQTGAGATFTLPGDQQFNDLVAAVNARGGTRAWDNLLGAVIGNTVTPDEYGRLLTLKQRAEEEEETIVPGSFRFFPGVMGPGR